MPQALLESQSRQKAFSGTVTEIVSIAQFMKSGSNFSTK